MYEKPSVTLPPIEDRKFWGWTRARALLSRFGLWKELAVEALNWIWEQRNEQGFWDLGSKMARRPYAFPAVAILAQAGEPPHRYHGGNAGAAGKGLEDGG